MNNQRRKILKLAGTALAAGLAGCSSDNEKNKRPNSGTDTTTENSYETEITFSNLDSLNILPFVNEENIDNKAGLRLEVEDQDGLERIQLTYNDQHRDQPHTIYDRAKNEFENGAGNQMIPISQEFPQRIIAPETGEFTVKATDVTGNTETRTEQINLKKPAYRADRKRIESQDAEPTNIGNYNTERNWDNITTNTQELREAQKQWRNQEAYTPLVEQIMSGEEFEAEIYPFPNFNIEQNDRGSFQPKAVQNEDDFEQIIRWYLPAIMEHDRENYGTAPSSRNFRFAETMEKLIDEHHPNAKAEATSVNSLPGHGIFGIQDQNNEEFYLVDTTSAPQYDGAVGQIGDFNTSGYDPDREPSRQNLWDPFHEFQPGPSDFPSYTTKSRKALAGLTGFASTSSIEENFDNMFATDQWMNEAYELLRNGGSIKPIKDPLEEIGYNTEETDQEVNIGIYGTLDDTRIAIETGDQIYNKVMHQPEPQTIQDIENYLTQTA